MKATLILTVKNEYNSVDYFFETIRNQSLLPDEIIITDAGSTDGTYERLLSWKEHIPNLKIVRAFGANRSKGRNIAISQSENEIIAMSDFGCKPYINWFEEITKPFLKSDCDVVSGYYVNNGNRLLSVAIGYFTHPCLNEINQDTFLPSARSMAIRKCIWETSRGFPEWLDFAEDTYFDNKLQKDKRKFIFNPNAVVEWNPENKVIGILAKIFKYSKWDAIAGQNTNLYLKKSALYFLFILILIFTYVDISFIPVSILFFSGYGYKTFIEAVNKLKIIYPSFLALLLKPMIDSSQILGYLSGVISKIFYKKYHKN